jgi:hypothetical protein
LKLGDVKILVGINVDHMIAEAQRRGLMFMGDPDKKRKEFIPSQNKVCGMLSYEFIKI